PFAHGQLPLTAGSAGVTCLPRPDNLPSGKGWSGDLGQAKPAILARRDAIFLVESAREVRRAVEPPGKRDLREGVRTPRGVRHLPGAFLQPAAQDVGAHLLSTWREHRA